ncbi:MAG: response regulator [Gemmatimonadales bacterium]|nr:response regulator [Gemmatimonadales bacterium]
MTEAGTREDQERRATSGRRRTDHDGRYEKLVELALDGILIHDGERILVANTAALRLAGADHRDQLIGRPIDAFLNPPYLKAVQSALLRSGDQAALVPSVRDAFRRLDGSEIAVEVTAIAFIDRDRPCAHLVVRDIRERLAVQATARQAEEFLRQAQKMDAVGALAGGVAHEVNNMMAVVLGFGEFLLQDPALPEDRLPDVRQIMKAADRAAMVTRELLAFSRRAFHKPEALELNAVVCDIVPMVRRLLGEGRELTFALGGPCRVWADKGQLEQVVVNLALNARDAMPSRGTLTITTAEVRLEDGASGYAGVSIPGGHYGLIAVRDTGLGMDEATQARIFEPFFTTKPVGEGTGLGLAAAYGIMEQNKGYIAVASAPEQGTTFRLYLPLSPDGPVSDGMVEPLPGAADTPGATVLVVEDEPAVRAVIVRGLEGGGFRVLEASDGGMALQVVDREGCPDLVLTDLMMPGIGGAELAQHLRGRWPDLRVMFMSGYSTEDLRRQGAVTPEGVTIQKPFALDTLLRSVNLMLATATSK